MSLAALHLRKPFLEKECAEVRNGMDAVFEPYVAVGDFHAKGNVGIMVGFDKGLERLGTPIGLLYLNRHDVGPGSQKEVLFQFGIVSPVVVKLAAARNTFRSELESGFYTFRSELVAIHHTFRSEIQKEAA